MVFENNTDKEKKERERRDAYAAGRDHANTLYSRLVEPIPHANNIAQPGRNDPIHEESLRQAYNAGVDGRPMPKRAEPTRTLDSGVTAGSSGGGGFAPSPDGLGAVFVLIAAAVLGGYIALGFAKNAWDRTYFGGIAGPAAELETINQAANLEFFYHWAKCAQRSGLFYFERHTACLRRVEEPRNYRQIFATKSQSYLDALVVDRELGLRLYRATLDQRCPRPLDNVICPVYSGFQREIFDKDLHKATSGYVDIRLRKPDRNYIAVHISWDRTLK